MSITSLSGLSGMPSLFIFDTEVQKQSAPLTMTANDPQVKADVTYFTSHIAKLKSVNDFLNDPKLVNFVLTAFGLQSETSAMGIVKQVLTQDPTSSTSLANQLADPRWQKLATALDFYHRGVAGLQAYTSTTSQKIGSGSFTFTLNTSPNFKIGQTVTFADSAHPRQNFLVGSVTAINGSSVTLSVQSGIGAVGSGTIANWTAYANNAKSGGTTTLPSTVVQNIVQQYTTAQFENNLGQASTPAEEAAYFLRNIGGATSYYQILADPVLLNVVEGAYGIPKNIAVQPIADQAHLLQSQFDIKTLENPNATKFANANTDQTTLQNVGQVTSAAQSAVQSVVSQIQSIVQQYEWLPGVTDPSGSNSAAIALQQNSVPVLAQASGLIGAANTALGSASSALATLNQLVTQAPSADSTTLATYKAQFQQLTAQIQSNIANASYTSPATGTTDNLLTNGSLSLSATVKTGETITFNGIGMDTSTLASQLNAANTAFQSMTVGGTVDPTVSSNLSSAGSTVSTTQTQVTGQLRNWNQAVQDSGTFVAALSSGPLNAGLAAGQDAQSRMTTIGGDIQQLQTLANESADPSFSGDRTALNTQAQTLISQINSSISTQGTGISDNLLTASQTYSLIGSDSLTMRSAALNTSITNNLTGTDISTQSGGQSLQNLITNTLQPALQQAQAQMSTDVNTVSTTINTFDPRAKIDTQLKKLVSNMSTIEASAGVNGQNLIATNAQTMGVSLKTTGDNFTIHAYGDFDSQVTGVLQQAVTALSTSSTAPTSLLQQALGNAESVQTELNGDVANLTPDQNKINALVTQQTQQNTAAQTDPYTQASAAAQQLVQRYLALQDAQNSTSSPNAYLLTLLGNATTQGVVNIDLSSLNLTA
ncbi:MAG TPA: DUF1217 domain-containing protein [Alphaproteobacteria bacterium]|nr:DUF1217 domain-containing protein [Alphaproteobacteria bacterium]